MAYLPPLNGGRVNVTLGGNTAGASTLVSSGTLTLAGGNNITLSQAGNAITISGGAGGGAGSNTLGMSNLGNTSGTSGALSGTALQFAFAGGNNITLSQSLNASSGTITISAASQSVQTQNLHNVTLSGNTAGVMAQVSSGTLTLAGGNNITLSQNGNAITISGGAGGGGGGIALANSQTTYTSGTANLIEGGGAITIASTTGQSFNISVPATSSLSATGAVSISTNGSTISIGVPMFDAGVSTMGNTAGTTGTNTNGLVLVGGNNISLSQGTGANGATVTIDGAAGGGGGGGATLSYYNPQDAYLQVTGQQGNGTLHIQPTPAPNVTFDRAVFPIVFTGATGSTASITLSMMMGIFTRNSSTLSLLASFSTSGAITHSGTANSSQNVGLKMFTMGASSSLSEGQYYVGILSRTSSGGANATVSQIVASQQNSFLSGFWGQANSASIQYTRGLGVYTASTSAMPSSIAFSQINGTGSMVLRQPMFYLINGTV